MPLLRKSAFVDACLDGTDTPVGAFDGLQPVKIAIAAKKSYESAENQ